MRPPSCAEISHLPKIPEGIRSINFRRTTPGSIRRVVHARGPPQSETVIDPTHPALAYNTRDFMRAFPWRACTGFRLRAIPQGLLVRPTLPFSSPPYALSTGPPRPGQRSVNMSLLDIAPRNVGGHVVRQDVLRKIKTAIALIVTRGADVEGPEGEKKLVFKGTASPDDWVLHNWTYIIRPEDEVYNMPWTRLVPALRDALGMTAATGRRLEREWAKMKEVVVRSPRDSQPRGLRLPSHAPPEPTDADKVARQALSDVLQRLARGRPQSVEQRKSEASSEQRAAPSDAESQKSSSLNDIFSRHMKPKPVMLPTLPPEKSS